MNEGMDKVLGGYPTKGYVVRATAMDNEFSISYHKEFMPAHATYFFDNIEKLLEVMEEIAAFSDWKDMIWE
jgi:hypothetical protein